MSGAWQQEHSLKLIGQIDEFQVQQETLPLKKQKKDSDEGRYQTAISVTIRTGTHIHT